MPSGGGKVGRPSDYDEALAREICERVAKDESLVSICADEHMPSNTTVYRWRDSNEEFRANYARARTDQGHTVADTVGEIRRKLMSGEIDPATATAAANIAKWEAGRRAAKHYGDKLELSGDADAPLNMSLAVHFVRADKAS